jgi:hypothetical protein
LEEHRWQGTIQTKHDADTSAVKKILGMKTSRWKISYYLYTKLKGEREKDLDSVRGRQ